MLEVNARLTCAMMLTTFPTLESTHTHTHTHTHTLLYYKYAVVYCQHSSSREIASIYLVILFYHMWMQYGLSENCFKIHSIYMLPNGVFKMDVVHRRSDTGTSCVSLSWHKSLDK